MYNIYIPVKTCYKSTLFVLTSVERYMNKNSLPSIISMFLLPSKNVFSIRSGYNINFIYNFVVGIQTDITIIEYKIIELTFDVF